jgi:hypothetical protein
MQFMNNKIIFFLFTAFAICSTACKKGADGLDYNNNAIMEGTWEVTTYEYMTYDTLFNQTVLETLSGNLATILLKPAEEGEISTTTTPVHGGVIFAFSKQAYANNRCYDYLSWICDRHRIHLGIKLCGAVDFLQGTLSPWGSNTQTWEFLGFPKNKPGVYMIKERYTVTRK